MSEQTAEGQVDSVQLGQELKAVMDYVQDCERRVHRGDIMDLRGLDAKVIALCEAISLLPPKQAQDFEPRMTQLIAGLETLAVALKQQQDLMTAGGKG
jgi:hypothetical protein